MNRLVYIAGPISKGNPFVNVRDACLMWEKLRQCGVTAFCPHLSALQEMIAPVPYREWLEYDFKIISHCAAVLRLPGESAGADEETALALRLGIPVFTDLESLLLWWHDDIGQPFVCDTRSADPVFSTPGACALLFGGSLEDD